MNNTITYQDLKSYYLENPTALENAKKYFGDEQPNYHVIGYYHPSGANWNYQLGIVGIAWGDQSKFFEIVTQFGQVKAARQINIPVMEGK